MPRCCTGVEFTGSLDDRSDRRATPGFENLPAEHHGLLHIRLRPCEQSSGHVQADQGPAPVGIGLLYEFVDLLRVLDDAVAAGRWATPGALHRHSEPRGPARHLAQGVDTSHREWRQRPVLRTTQVQDWPSRLFTAVLLAPPRTEEGLFTLAGARVCMRPGRGQHRRVTRASRSEGRQAMTTHVVCASRARPRPAVLDQPYL